MSETIDELTSQATLRLADLGYRPTTIQQYKSTWNAVRRWCADRGIERYGSEQESLVVSQLGLDRNILFSRERERLRHIRALLTLEESGCMPSFSRRLPAPIPVRILHVFEAYAAHLQQRGLAKSILRGQSCIIGKF